MSWNQFGLQDASSPVMEEFIFFHDSVVMVIFLIVSLVGYMVFTMLLNKYIQIGLVESQARGGPRMLMAAMLLLQVALPYPLDDTLSSTLTLSIGGQQGYWTFESFDFRNFDLEVETYLESTQELEQGLLLRLETDNRLTLPYQVQIRVMGSSADANPVRLNQLKLFTSSPGVVYSEHSEISRANYSFTSIELEFFSSGGFLLWVSLAEGQEGYGR